MFGVYMQIFVKLIFALWSAFCFHTIQASVELQIEEPLSVFPIFMVIYHHENLIEVCAVHSKNQMFAITPERIKSANEAFEQALPYFRKYAALYKKTGKNMFLPWHGSYQQVDSELVLLEAGSVQLSRIHKLATDASKFSLSHLSYPVSDNPGK